MGIEGLPARVQCCHVTGSQRPGRQAEKWLVTTSRKIYNIPIYTECTAEGCSSHLQR